MYVCMCLEDAIAAHPESREHYQVSLIIPSPSLPPSSPPSFRQARGAGLAFSFGPRVCECELSSVNCLHLQRAYMGTLLSADTTVVRGCRDVPLHHGEPNTPKPKL